jgi:hypothetical protein
MNERIFGVVATGIALAGLAATLPAAAQGDKQQPSKASTYKMPKTAWGEPDIQGLWPIGHMAGTPLVRPKEFGTRRFFTDEEFQARQQRDQQLAQRYSEENKENKIGMGHWDESGQAQRITSFIVEPADGQFPELTDWAKKEAQTMGSSWYRTAWDRPEDFDTWDRCITRGLPASMFPMHYNNGIQIVQAPGYVVMRLEMIHEARIIPTTDQPLDSSIKQWLGASQGHWEGNTLVVETTNFNGIPGMTNIGTIGSPRGNVPESTEMRLTERFTRISDDEMEYSIRVDDPKSLKQPWTAAYTWKLDPEYGMYEYACHEGNEQVRNYIVTSRYDRAHPDQQRQQ